MWITIQSERKEANNQLTVCQTCCSYPREQYGLARQDFCRFLQLRNHGDETISKEDLENLSSGSGKLNVFSSAYTAEPGHKTISRLYKGL